MALPRRWLRFLGFGEEVEEVAIGVAEVDGARGPGLGGGRLDPGLNEWLQPGIFVVHIGNAEFENDTAAAGGFGDVGDVLLLGGIRKNGERADGAAKFDVVLS